MSTCPSVLDNTRLNKQRLETFQILKALTRGSKAWANHPATKMWEGYIPTLVQYGLFCCDNCDYRGIADNTQLRHRILEFHPQYEETKESINWIRRKPHLLPWWWGEALNVHKSHRESLTFKSESYYGPKFRMSANHQIPPVYTWPLHYYDWDRFRIDDVAADVPDIHAPGKNVQHCSFRFLRLAKQPTVSGIVVRGVMGHTLVYCESFNRKRVQFLLESRNQYNIKLRNELRDYFEHWDLRSVRFRSRKNVTPGAFTWSRTEPEIIPGLTRKRKGHKS